MENSILQINEEAEESYALSDFVVSSSPPEALMILSCLYSVTQVGSGGPDVLTSIFCGLEMRNCITEQEK